MPRLWSEGYFSSLPLRFLPLWWNKHSRLRVHQKLAELGEK